MEKITSLIKLTSFRKKTTKKTIVILATGVFDILHSEHRNFLKKAKRQGDILVVGVESDERVKKNKGKGRPVHDQKTRANHLSSLETVDFVVILPSTLATKQGRELFIKTLQPNVYAVSSNTPFIEEKQRIMTKFGGKLKIVHAHNPKISTSLLLKKENK